MKDGIQQQATRMMRTTTDSLHPEINDCVSITVPQVDRSVKMIVKNIIGVIIEIKEKRGHKFYNVATQHGCIRPLLSRNQFEMCRQRNIIDVETVDREGLTSVRKIAIAEAKRGSEEPSTSFCRCATDFCRTLRCLCRRSHSLCTDRCQHGRNPKTGRIDKNIAANFKCTNV